MTALSVSTSMEDWVRQTFGSVMDVDATLAALERDGEIKRIKGEGNGSKNEN